MNPSPPAIDASSFLTLHYRLSGLGEHGGGDFINTFDDKPATLSLGTPELSSVLQNCLIGLPEGAHEVFKIGAGEAFGQRNIDMQQWVARSLLRELGDPKESYTEGDVVQFPTPDGASRFAGVVRAIDDARVLFDFNHPLAGMAVRFEVKIIGVL